MIVAIIAVGYGQGRHIQYLQLDTAVEALKYIFIGEFILILDMAVVKLSVTLFLLRFGLRKWLRWVVITSISLLSLSTVAFIIILFSQCKPITANWDPRVSGICYGPNVLMIVLYITTGVCH